jgi:hypothetical protein
MLRWLLSEPGYRAREMGAGWSGPYVNRIRAAAILWGDKKGENTIRSGPANMTQRPRYHRVMVPSIAPDDAALLAEQVAYYRARAGEYDEWWLRTGRYDRGAAFERAMARRNGRGRSGARRVPARANAATRSRVRLRHRAVHAASRRARAADRRGRCVARGDRDQSCALRRSARRNRYVDGDIFDFRPTERFDLVFFSFWLSHVPDTCFARFWQQVRDCLAPGGPPT